MIDIARANKPATELTRRETGPAVGSARCMGTRGSACRGFTYRAEPPSAKRGSLSAALTRPSPSAGRLFSEKVLVGANNLKVIGQIPIRAGLPEGPLISARSGPPFYGGHLRFRIVA